MDKETDETKIYKKRKLGILSIFAIILLLIFILINYVFIINRSKVLAPSAENKTTEEISQQLKKTPDSSIPKESVNAYDTLYTDGMALFNKNDMDGAIAKFNQAIQIDPINSSAYLAKSSAESKKGLTAEAINTVEAGLKYNPQNENLKTKLDLLKTNLYEPQVP